MGMKMRRRVLAAALIVLVLFVGTFCVGYFQLGFAAGEKVVAQNVHVNATLHENGDIYIEETSTFQYKNRGKDWWNFYRTFAWEEIGDIRNVSVYDHDNQTEYAFTDSYWPTGSPNSNTPFNTCYLVQEPPWELIGDDGTVNNPLPGMAPDPDAYWEIGFNFQPLAEGSRTFTLRYTLSGVTAIEKYSDADVLYFMFVQQDTYPIQSFSMDLYFPNAGGAEDVVAWLHCKASGAFAVQSSGHIAVEASKIAGDDYLEMRLLLPVGSLQSAPVQHTTPTRAAIVQQETAWQAAWFDASRYKWFIAVASVVLWAGILLLAFALNKLQKRLDKKSIPDVDEPEYERQIPSAVSPAVVGQLINHVSRGRKQKEKTSNMIVASTLNMVNKGWLQMNNSGDSAKQKKLWLKPVKGHTSLSQEEKALHNLYQTVAQRNGGRFTMVQYNIFAKNQYADVQSAMRSYFARTKRQFRAQNWGGQLKFFTSFCGWLCIAFLVAAAVLAFGFSFFGRGVLVVGFLLGAAILFFGAIGRTYLTRAGRTAYARWLGFKRYLKDFSLIEERSIEEVSLWGDYLVYGTVLEMGAKITKRLSRLTPKTLKEMQSIAPKDGTAPVQNEPFFPSAAQSFSGMHIQHSFATGLSEHTGGTVSSGFNFAALGNNFSEVFKDILDVGEALNIANRQSAAVSSAASSSGGSSGGGGSDSGSSFSGGGGGGGGGSSGFR